MGSLKDCRGTMRSVYTLLAALSLSKAASPLYRHPHHIHSDSGRGGYGPNHVNQHFPARLLQLCDGIVDHGHSSGPQVLGQKVFRVGASISCDELIPSGYVVSTTAAPASDSPTTDSPSTEASSTGASSTEAPSTEAPTTAAPTTEAPTTAAPTTTAAPSSSEASTAAETEATLASAGEDTTGQPAAETTEASTEAATTEALSESTEAASESSTAAESS